VSEQPDSHRVYDERKAERLDRRARLAVYHGWGLPKQRRFAQPCHAIIVHVGARSGPAVSAAHDRDSPDSCAYQPGGPPPACEAFAKPARQALFEASGWRSPAVDDARLLHKALQARGWNLHMNIIDDVPDSALVKVIPRITIDQLLDVGLLLAGQAIRTVYKDREFTAIIEGPDVIRLNGVAYPTLAEATCAVQEATVGHHASGAEHDAWSLWVAPVEYGRSVVLGALRRQLAEQVCQESERSRGPGFDWRPVLTFSTSA
jgi:hypothetical protein